jgi:hypothetical protein
MDVIQQLSLLGLSDPPTICAVGAQNTGKSTVLNALAGINIFPARNDKQAIGAMTKSQIIVNVRPGDTWNVSIEHGSKSGVATTATKSELERCIYDLLASQQSDSPYKMLSGSGMISMPFKVNITGPGLPHIHFIDNPGIVSDNEHRMQDTLFINENSIQGRKYTIVLFFVTTSDDPSNSPAWRIINKFKGQVMMILTKPDLALAGGAGVLRMITNGFDSKIPSHNVFVTKGPDSSKEENCFDQSAEDKLFRNRK